MTEEIKPCPMCGANGLVGETLDGQWYAMCMADECIQIENYWPTKAEAITDEDRATAALKALRETLVPWGYAVEEEGHPIISYVTREKPTEPAINVTPLYALPEVKP